MEYVVLGGFVGGIWAFLLWLSIIVWVYRDIRDRSQDLALQVLAIFVVLMFFPGFNIPGLLIYLMLRPHETADEAYARSLEEEALLREIGDEGTCPSCRRFVERGWRFCPFCETQIRDICVDCGHLLSFNWVACPNCGRQRKGATIAQEPGAARAAARGSGSQWNARTTAAQGDEEKEQATTEGVTPHQH